MKKIAEGTKTKKFQIVATGQDAVELVKFQRYVGDRQGNKVIKEYIRQFNKNFLKTIKAVK